MKSLLKRNLSLPGSGDNVIAARLRALGIPGFRLYFAGQTISMVGTSMQAVAESWLVFRITGSSSWLGLVAFASQFCSFLITPLAGVVSDRFERRKILQWAAGVMLTEASILAALTLSGKVQPWQIALLSLCSGLAYGFELTTRHAFSADLAGVKNLSSALSLNGITLHGSRVIGACLAGILIEIYGNEGWVFLLNALSYLAVIYSLARVRVSAQSAQPHVQKSEQIEPLIALIKRDLLLAWSYVSARPAILRLLVFGGLLSFLAFPHRVLLPAFAKMVLGGDSSTLVWLSGASGLGAVIGLFITPFNSDFERIEKNIRRDMAVAGICLFILGWSKWPALSIGATFTIAGLLMTVFPRINNAIQQIVDDRFRSRVLSFYSMALLGTLPTGSIIFGWLSEKFGPQSVVESAGFLCLVFAFLANQVRTLKCPK